MDTIKREYDKAVSNRNEFYFYDVYRDIIEYAFEHLRKAAESGNNIFFITDLIFTPFNKKDRYVSQDWGSAIIQEIFEDNGIEVLSNNMIGVKFVFLKNLPDKVFKGERWV